MVDQIERVSSFRLNLTSATRPQVSFSQMMLLIDDDQIPVDTRVRTITPANYTDLETTSTPFKYASVFFGQAKVPENMLLGRWISADSETQFIWGSAYEADYLVWKAISNGEFQVQDSAANIDVISGLDFSAITSFSQVLTVLTTAVQAVGAPNITNLNTAEFVTDGLGRIVLKMPKTAGSVGSTAPTIVIEPVTVPVGTDVSVLMDAANGTSIAGQDAESPLEAVITIRAYDDGWYIHECYGATQTQLEELSAGIQGLRKQLDIVTNDPNVKDPLSTTDIAYNLSQLSHKRTMIIYTEKTDEYPFAAFEGRMISETEGKVNGAGKVLIGVTVSGSGTGLTEDNKLALEDKNCNWLEDIEGVYVYEAITANNLERRLVTGFDWFEAVNQIDNFVTWRIEDVLTYINDDVAKIENNLRARVEEATVDRKIFLDTPKYPFVISFPDADDIPEEDRSAREFNFTDVFKAYASNGANKIVVTGDVVTF